MRDRYANHFENNRAIARINRAYVAANPGGFAGYDTAAWGLTANDGPWGYQPHEPREGLDDGTITPTGALASFPYTPEESMAALRYFYDELGHQLWDIYGFRDGYNLTEDWVAPIYMGLDQAPLVVERRDDPVSVDLVAWHPLDGDHRTPVRVVLLDQLFGHRLPAAVEHHVVGEEHGKRLVPDQLLGHQHRVAEPELLLLVDECDRADLGDAADRPQHLDVAALLEPALEGRMRVEVLLDGAPAAGDDDDDLLDSRGDRLLDRVLDDRSVDQWDHLLGDGLGRGQEASAEAGRRQDGLSDAHSDQVSPRAGCSLGTAPAESQAAPMRGCLTGEGV